MKPRKILAKVLASPANVRFSEMQRLVEAFGFRLLRVSGSHHIYGRAGLNEQVNIQEVNGKAKPYQIRQFLKLVERYNLNIEDN
jgi:predicted RNA binding protein YcfA (HicA-like mRNA interferase family)